jgi:plastocyanin
MTGRRWLVLLLAPLLGAVIVFGVLLLGRAIASAAASSKVRTTAVGVGLREYRIALYRSRVLPGRVRFNMENLGEDAHDLRVIGPSGSASAVRGTSAVVKAGGRGVFTVTLKRRGLYRMVCTLGDHEAQGMVARMRVVRKL